jgi:lipopolysaccharide transport system permease protein
MNLFQQQTSPPTMERVIRHKSGLIPLDFRELWRYHELFFFLIWRDILVRYKQTAIGVAWAVIQPLLTMIVLTMVFGKLAGMPSHNAPYALMTFSALLPWQFFANAVTFGSNSLINQSNMIRKIYFPRLIFPASAAASGTVDFLISLTILAGLMLHYGVVFRPQLLLLPLFFLAAILASMAVSLWLSALNVKYRDVKYVVPFIVRIGLYISPVGFMSSVVPEKWRFLYSLNPIVGVIDGFRWAILGDEFEPYWPGFSVSLAITLLLLLGGAYFFRSTEKTFADVI